MRCSSLKRKKQHHKCRKDGRKNREEKGGKEKKNK